MVQQLTTEAFKAKVMDFEKESEWKFLGSRPAIIDFYADWCGPCKMLSPIFEKLSKEYDGQVDFYKVDTDAQPQVSSVFGISSIPSILFVPMGDKPQMAQGALPEHALREVIGDVLKVQAAK